MSTRNRQPTANLLPLLIAWLGLVTLTFVSLGLGAWLGHAPWLPTLVAAIIWLKAWLVAYFFLEAQLSQAFIRRLVWTFITFAPIALVLTDLFGHRFVNLIRL